MRKALDFGAAQSQGTPRFFSENMADLSEIFALVQEASVSTEETAHLRRQIAIYR